MSAPKPRTLEEIAERVWLDGEDDMHYEVFLAALREAADSARDAEREAIRDGIARMTSRGHRHFVQKLLLPWLDSRKDQA